MASVLAGMLMLDAGPVRAQDLDAGKSGQRLFATNCAACHRTPRGLAKGRNRILLFYFLRQHYTASQTSAAELTAHLLAAGEAPRAGGKSTPRRPQQR
ncbi:MAG TPA: c-type cytochrome [Xanthobacteraceae bacterium]|nr:c-type cytochrome [Xanthobacteraceae bacterium]